MPTMTAKGYWILGAGRFGSRAARKLAEHLPGSPLTVVDRDPTRLESHQAEGRDVVCSDAAAFLHKNLLDAGSVDWVVPAVPVHLMLEWARLRLPGLRVLRIPEAVAAALPHPIRGAGEAVYTSLADFLCPEDCPEPAGCCTVTGKPRPFFLFAHIGELSVAPFAPVVLRSRQLLPGVGGIPPAAMLEALRALEEAGGPVLLATACRCHGVVHALDHDRSLNGVAR
jgi:hypothetical protein